LRIMARRWLMVRPSLFPAFRCRIWWSRSAA
jgi:hypothetical protein